MNFVMWKDYEYAVPTNCVGIIVRKLAVVRYFNGSEYILRLRVNDEFNTGKK
jgi:hypothetical protein